MEGSMRESECIKCLISKMRMRLPTICFAHSVTKPKGQWVLRLDAKTAKAKGGFPVMAEITRILAANIRRQSFSVVTIAMSTRCLVQNFQLICYSQRVNVTS